MNRIYEVLIVGGGFSGAVAACNLAERYGDAVALLERNPRLCKKVSATGNGRCNITNARVSADRDHSVCGANVENALSRFDNRSLAEWFLSVGVPVCYEGDKAYPSSRQASSVAESLKDKLLYENASVFYEFNCVGLKKDDDGLFIAQSGDGRTVTARKAIIACGGKSGAQYGSDGSGYVLAKSLGHTVTATYPSIVQLITDKSAIKGLKGVKTEADVTVFVGGKKTASTRGDVLFTDYGLSGNAIFSVSPYVVGNNDVTLALSFLPEYTQKRLEEILIGKIETLPYADREKLLNGIVHGSLARAVYALTDKGKSPYALAARLAEKLKNFPVRVLGTLGFDGAQVTRGGVKFSEVNESTMESKLVDGLYVVGETLDVDGDCGGFNLQWAYSSAMAASEDLLKK